MSKTSHTLLFAVILCIAISLLLTAASTGLQKYQQINIRLDKQKNILKSVGLIHEGRDYTADRVESLYQENIRPAWADPAGGLHEKPPNDDRDLPLYIFVKNRIIHAYILPIHSRGLWGKISGYLAVGKDGATISGFTVYHHSETPGLGGEIEKAWFQKNFVGKKLVNRTGEFVSVSIAKGKAADKAPAGQQDHYVDGISGATLTGKYLTAGMKANLLDYEPVSITFRKNPLKKWP